MYELRILNGAKKGVSFVLDNEPIKVGAALSNELVVQDEGIRAEHVEIGTDDLGNALIMPIKGKVIDVRGGVIRDSTQLKEGVPFQLSSTWVVVQSIEKPWPTRLPKVIAPELKPNSVIWKFIALKHGAKAQKVMLQSIFVVLILIGINSFAISKDHQELEVSPSKVEAMPIDSQSNQQKPKTVYSQPPEKRIETSADVKTNLSDGAETLVRSMLDERQLEGVKVVMLNDELVLEGKINAREQTVISRMIIRYQDEFPNYPKLISATEMLAEKLPFEIRSIVSGPFSHITTGDGQQMSVGQVKLGFTLVSIKEDTLVFEGDQRVEVNW